MTAGRPPQYETVEELDNKISIYFNDCPDKRKQYTSEGAEYFIEVPTVTGLALYLGFCSRQSMYDYEKNEKFSYSIKKARTCIENIYEQNLQLGQATTGAIFALKNMGWKDKQEVVNHNENYDCGVLKVGNIKDVDDWENKAINQQKDIEQIEHE